MGKEKSTIGGDEMTTDNNDIGSGRSHNERKEDAREIGRKQMSQEEFDRDLGELKERLNIIR
jgi:hypothetical protein